MLGLAQLARIRSKRDATAHIEGLHLPAGLISGRVNMFAT